MLCTYVLGWLFNISLAFCMGEPADLLLSSTGNPVIQIFFDSLGTRGAIAFSVFAVIILQFVCFTATQALARTVFAFSRDRLIPFSNVWVKIDKRTGTPLYAVWISVFFCIAINLIGLGSYAAISGVFNVCAIALDWSYCVPIACKLMFGKFTPGPWHMGKLSFFVNMWALIWTTFVTIIFILPVLLPVTGDNMNYAIVFLAAILLFSMIFWYLGGRKHYTGPLIEAQIRDEAGSNSESDGIQGAKGEVKV